MRDLDSGVKTSIVLLICLVFTSSPRITGMFAVSVDGLSCLLLGKVLELNALNLRFKYLGEDDTMSLKTNFCLKVYLTFSDPYLDADRGHNK